MKKTQQINWKPFSQKHKDYIKNALHNKMNVAEGAIRSGKTIDHCIIAAMYLEQCPDRIHLATGSTLGNAKLNIGVCNGFGLENLFRGRCKWGKYKDNEALFLKTQTGDKVVIFAGGSKADAYKRILGNSYGLWIATEINEHYDCDDSRTSFIKVAFGRQVAAVWPLVLWDLNPCNPSHRIYKDYIDLYKTQYVGGYQYEHFTIHDNLSISEERKREIESQYVKGSVWYRRDILGERCIAEGLVYPMWEDAFSEPPEDVEPSEYCVSMDYGTMNAFAALLWAKYGNVWYAVREYYYSGRSEGRQKTDEDYGKDIDAWVADIEQPNGGKLPTIIDPSAASFIALLRKRGERYKVIPADNDVLDGIRETANALENGHIKISPKLKAWREEAGGYIWDDKAVDDRPVKVNDHCLTGDTLVMTESGSLPISDLVGTEGKVWSYNTDTGVAELKPYSDCRMTRQLAEILEIETEDERIIRCTEDHPILTERGYVVACELLPSDRIVDIMTISYLENGDLALFNGLKFRRDKHSGYYLNSTIHKRLHVYVWEFFNGKVPSGYQIHHKDFDKSNNKLENLILLSASDHAKLHGESWDDERYEKQIKNLNENARPKASEWHGSNAGHEWHKKHYEQMKSRLHQKKIFVCEECGQSFEGVDNGFTRFCSNKCKAAHRRKSGVDNEIRQCEYCGKKFEVNKYAKTRTCSRSAEIKSVGIKAIKRVDPEPVYNMEVEDNHNFAVANGLIVHNCMDATRYFVKTKKIIKKTLRRDNMPRLW